MATLDLHPDDLALEGEAPRARDRLVWSPGSVHWAVIVAFVLAHAGFGLVSDYSPPPLSTLHAVATLVAAVWLVGVRRNPEGAACIAAYLAASDVLWRMTRASVPWEVSKLSLIAVFLFGVVRIIRKPRRLGLPLTLLFLLLPSAVVTIERFGILGNGRERLSFELAAHVALVFGVIFFSNMKAERQTVAGVLWMIVGPVVAVNTIATAGTIGLDSSDFSGGLSNFASSGGYGPNQVSALIGVGAMVSVFLVFIDRRPVLRVVAAGLAIWFLAQSALTFSRGGSFNLVVALIVATPFFLRTAQVAARFLAVIAVVALVVAFVMIPVIQHITGNQFGQRFTSSDPTLRTDLMRSELSAWEDNIALGVGVGMMERTVGDRGAGDRGELPKLPTHTEYTRLLAEHGLLGLAAILVLIALAVRSVRSQRTLEGRILAVVLIAWCASEISHSATRLALVSFLFALASLPIVEDGALEPVGRPPRPTEGQDPVEPDGPPPSSGARRRQNLPADLPARREGAEALDAAVGEPVDVASREAGEPELGA
jgi:hypothetical protein